MLSSLRFRLLLAMIALPAIALVSIGVVMTWTTRASLDDSFKFTVIPVSRGTGSGVRSPNPDEFEIDVRSVPPTVEPGTRPIVYEPDTGDAYMLQAERGFIAAYKRDQQDAINTLNRNLAIAVGAFSLTAAVIAFALSRRILGPVESLTGAARRLEGGDLKQRVDIRSRDEIGELGHAFNAMAESLERNETLRKQMTSDVAHELRTPLNNISGYLDAITDGVVEPDERVITSLQEESALLVRLVGDLEQLSLADAGQQQLFPERLAMEELISRAVDGVAKRAASKSIAVTTDYASRIPAVDADRGRMGQVLRNLLENAVTHTPEGGSIAVSLRASQGIVSVSVTDSGPGIPAQHLPFIFERFYRADRSRARATGGAGLGLAIVKQIVESHGGTVRAENATSGGARLTVSLPAAPPERASMRAPEPAPA
ncbi:MAG TPA: ATP-binding protein [Tepidiformaceae bacterium]|nr:ATP-binding protein [Tepidiformaceae bacterium]